MRGAVPCLSTESDNPRRTTLYTGFENGKALNDSARGCGDERGKPRRYARIRTMSDDAETSDERQCGRATMLKELAAAVLFGASRRGRGREARRGLQPGDVRSSLRRAATGEGAEALCSSARVGVGEGAEA